MPEDMVAKMVDTKNEVSVTVIENPDGSFSYSSKHSLTPELNFSSTYKVENNNIIRYYRQTTSDRRDYQDREAMASYTDSHQE